MRISWLPSQSVSVVTISAGKDGLVSSDIGPLLRLSDTRFAAEPRSRFRIRDGRAAAYRHLTRRVGHLRARRPLAPRPPGAHAACRQLLQRRTPDDGEPRA